MKNELKQIARKIAKFPDHRFGSNVMSSKSMRLSFYIEAKNPTSQKLDNARETLTKLEAGERIVWAAFI
jgi:primosomal protein N''